MPKTDFVSTRETALRADGAARDASPQTDDFLKRLEAVETNPTAASLTWQLVSSRGASQSSQSPVKPIEADLTSLFEEEEEVTPDQKRKHVVPRHRRVYKEKDAVVGLTLMDHPVHPGVVVKTLDPNGSCLKHGVRVGDHILKINGKKPKDHREGIVLIDEAWTSQVDGEDKNKDRLKFSLADRTQDFVLRRVSERGAAGGGAAAASGAEDVGITLIDNSTAGLGVVVLHVAEGLPAARAGLQVGHVIQSVAGNIALEHKGVLKVIQSAYAAGEVRACRRHHPMHIILTDSPPDRSVC